MRRFLRNNGLSVVLLTFFALALVGQVIAGWRALDEELVFHGQLSVGLGEYLATGHFLSAVFENWESEFLQMAAYVILTVFLFQKGSADSKKPDEANPEDEPLDPANIPPDAPSPVRKGGLVLFLYSHSLSLAFLILFASSFCLHAIGSTRHSNEEALRHGQPAKTLSDTLAEPQFWYESFQNWQSEFLSVAVLLILAIYLRERGSPESKLVTDSHDKTGH